MQHLLDMKEGWVTFLILPLRFPTSVDQFDLEWYMYLRIIVFEQKTEIWNIKNACLEHKMKWM